MTVEKPKVDPETSEPVEPSTATPALLTRRRAIGKAKYVVPAAALIGAALPQSALARSGPKKGKKAKKGKK